MGVAIHVILPEQDCYLVAQPEGLVNVSSAITTSRPLIPISINMITADLTIPLTCLVRIVILSMWPLNMLAEPEPVALLPVIHVMSTAAPLITFFSQAS